MTFGLGPKLPAGTRSPWAACLSSAPAPPSRGSLVPPSAKPPDAHGRAGDLFSSPKALWSNPFVAAHGSRLPTGSQGPNIWR